jgi:glucose/arabinose dehydrogenase
MRRARRAGAVRRVAAVAGLVLATSGCSITVNTPSSSRAPAPSASKAVPRASSTSSSSARPGSPSTGAGTGASTAASGLRGSASVLFTGLEVPWGVAFLPDGSALVGERDSARILHISGTTGQPTLTELGTVPGVQPRGEGGLLGLAVSPDFATDQLVYAYFTSGDDNRIVRMRLDGDALGAPSPVFTGLPHANIHNGGRIAFGPDGMLYATVGDAAQPSRAQDWSYYGGKVLRMTPTGQPAPGNPRPDSVVYTIGHRNPQGLAWGPEGSLYEAEFGQNIEDEINLLLPGRNYGWPDAEGDTGDTREEFTRPLLTWSTNEASPSGLAYADGSLWLATLRGQRVYRIPVTSPGRVGQPVALFDGQYGRLRTIIATPTGSLWLTTSNRDGRGRPTGDDDRIIQIT